MDSVNKGLKESFDNQVHYRIRSFATPGEVYLRLNFFGADIFVVYEIFANATENGWQDANVRKRFKIAGNQAPVYACEPYMVSSFKNIKYNSRGTDKLNRRSLDCKFSTSLRKADTSASNTLIFESLSSINNKITLFFSFYKLFYRPE